jgi:hypothetical protein
MFFLFNLVNIKLNQQFLFTVVTKTRTCAVLTRCIEYENILEDLKSYIQMIKATVKKKNGRGREGTKI